MSLSLRNSSTTPCAGGSFRYVAAGSPDDPAVHRAETHDVAGRINGGDHVGSMEHLRRNGRHERIRRNAERFVVGLLGQHIEIQGGPTPTHLLPVYGPENADELDSLITTAFNVAERFEAEAERRKERDRA